MELAAPKDGWIDLLSIPAAAFPAAVSWLRCSIPRECGSRGAPLQPGTPSRRTWALPALPRSPRPQNLYFSARFSAASVGPTLTSSGCRHRSRSGAVSGPGAPGAAQHRLPGLVLPRGSGMHPAVLQPPVPSSATPVSCRVPAVDIAAGSSRAPSPEHPRIPGGDSGTPPGSKVAVTKARRGRGDPAIALGTFVTYSLPEPVDFEPSLGAALGRVWRRWHRPKGPREVLRTAGNPR